ncbi:HNH endonuclease family protein [Streptomyces californicus]
MSPATTPPAAPVAGNRRGHRSDTRHQAHQQNRIAAANLCSRSRSANSGRAQERSCRGTGRSAVGRFSAGVPRAGGCRSPGWRGPAGGSWLSYYDEVEVTDAKRLDIDHMVPLAEAWDSGAHDWTPERREAYANDLSAERSLVAVTAKTNRSKADKDPAAWMPPAESARCTYLVDWTATKLRWGLAADESEQAALLELAEPCTDKTVEFDAAP